MGHHNTQVTGHMMIDSETDQRGHNHPHPEPCILYGTVPNFPQPSIHPVALPPGNQCNFNYHHMPEHHDSALFYGMPQYNAVQPQHPVANVDLAVGTPSVHYSPYLARPSGVRGFPVQVNQGGAHDQLSLSATHRVVGFPADNYSRNVPYIDGLRGSFKRENHIASVGPSSSISPMNSAPAESDITVMDSTSFLPLEYIGNDQAPIVENGATIRSVRNRPGINGPEPVLIQGNYAVPPVQFSANPWLDMRFGANSGDVGTFAWTQAPLPYVHASVNGACVEAGNIGIQGCQTTSSNRNSSGFLHPSFPQSHPNPHHPSQPVQGLRGYTVNFPPQGAVASRRVPAITSNAGINRVQDVVDSVPTLLAPVPPTGFRFYQPFRRDIIHDQNARHRSLPHLRVLPEDEAAILEIPGYHDRESVDQHRDLRLDIDHMSYEELLALGEQIGSVGTGCSEEFIQNNLKVRIFTNSAACGDSRTATCGDQHIKFCVICQNEYEHEENIGTLDCGHEYHGECIKKWLLLKNACPVCKSTALNRRGNDL